MFKELGQIASVMKQLPKIREEMDKLQQRLAQITAEGDAGAGMVHVKANGKMEVVSCQISEEALAGGDREMLGDLVAAAVNQALERVRKQTAEEAGKLATGLGLPAGMNLPGVSMPGQ